MSTLTIGRMGIDVDVPNVLDLDLDAAVLRISGMTGYGSVADSVAVMRQINGYVDRADEDFVPVTWVERPDVNGYYRVRSAKVTPTPAAFAGLFAFDVELERVQNFSAPLIESVVVGATRAQLTPLNMTPNPSGETNFAGWVPIGGTSGTAAFTNPAPSTTTAYGTKVLKVTWSVASTAAGGGGYIEIPVSEYEVYSFGANHVKSSIGNRLIMQVEWRDGSPLAISTVSGTQKQVVAGTIYNTVDFKIENLTAPAGALSARLKIISIAGTGYANWSIGSYMEFDGVQSNRGTTLLAYTEVTSIPGVCKVGFPGPSKGLMAIESGTGVTSYLAAQNVQTSDGSVRLMEVPGASYARSYTPVADFYKGAATLQISADDSIIYGWLGPHHASMSYRVQDGVTDYNRALNPRAGTSLTGWSGFITGGGAATGSRAFSPAAGNVYVYRNTWNSPSTAGSVSSVGYGSGSNPDLPVVAGTTINPSIDVRCSITQRVGLRCVFYDDTNTVVGAQLVGDVRVLTDSAVFTRLELGPIVVPAGATRALIRASLEAGAGAVVMPSGAFLDVTKVSTAPGRYFDGDSENTKARAVAGRQIPNNPDNWILSNGSIQLVPSFSGGARFLIRYWTAAGAWTDWSEIALASGLGAIYAKPHTITVLRNAPEAVTLRLSTVYSGTALAPDYFSESPVTIDVTLRRGATYIAFEMNAPEPQRMWATLEAFSAAITVDRGYYLAGIPADTGRWIFAPKDLGYSGGQFNSGNGVVGAVSGWSFGVGYGEWKRLRNSPTDRVTPWEYLWAGYETMYVVTP